MEVERVQPSLSKDAGLGDLPTHFIRSDHERPENTKSLEGVKVPIVSLVQPRPDLVKKIAEASSEWGFFIIKDHGVPLDLIKKVQQVGAEFFDQPQAEKEKYVNDPSKGNFEGYGTKMVKNVDKKLEWIDYYFHFMAPPSKVNYNIWPKHPTTYREVTEEYNKEVLRLMEEILGLWSEGLDLDKDCLKNHLGDEDIELEMKINMYPPCPRPDLALGVEAHTDMSALTILVPNEITGLQVWKDNRWVAVDYYHDAIYIHVGDQIEIMSNGKYKSILHRSLVNKEKTRMSWAVFCCPPGDKVIGPISQLLDDQNNPAKYKAMTYSDYRYRKINNLSE